MKTKKAIFIYSQGTLFPEETYFILGIQKEFQFDICEESSISLDDVKKMIQENDLVIFGVNAFCHQEKALKNLGFNLLWVKLLKSSEEGAYSILNISDHSDPEKENCYENFFVFGDSSSFVNSLFISC